MSTNLGQIYDFDGKFSVVHDCIGIRGRAVRRRTDRAGTNEGNSVAFVDLCKVRVSVENKAATEFLRAQIQFQKPAFDVVFIPVRNEDFHFVYFDDFLVLKREVVAISFYTVKAFMTQNVAERTYAVAQKEDVFAFVCDFDKAIRKRIIMAVRKCDDSVHNISFSSRVFQALRAKLCLGGLLNSFRLRTLPQRFFEARR